FLVPTVEARAPSKAKRAKIHHKKKTKKKKKKRRAKPKPKTTPRPPTTSTTTSSGGQLAVVTSCGNVSAIPSAVNSTGDQAVVLCLLNNERAKAGLIALRLDPQLTSASISHSLDMVARQFFAHDAPGGSSPVSRMRAAGYIPASGAWQVGENIAWGSGSYGSLGSIMQAWMNSPPHRENILDPAFRDVGVGIAPGGPQGGPRLAAATYTTDFGKRG
ncbi:MAG: hypothetical protein QOK04_973, partial [Solirubrobacteraceae bacterium]|nr:hypothetical protein [Solirubrobacteraceae bacterium]